METSKEPPRLILISKNMIGILVSIVALVPKHSPAITFTVVLPSTEKILKYPIVFGTNENQTEKFVEHLMLNKIPSVERNK